MASSAKDLFRRAARVIALAVAAFTLTGCVCSTVRPCDARPASYKKSDVPPCKKGEMVYVYHPDTGLREVQIAPPLCKETRAQKRKRIEAERREANVKERRK